MEENVTSPMPVLLQRLIDIKLSGVLQSFIELSLSYTDNNGVKHTVIVNNGSRDYSEIITAADITAEITLPPKLPTLTITPITQITSTLASDEVLNDFIYRVKNGINHGLIYEEYVRQRICVYHYNGDNHQTKIQTELWAHLSNAFMKANLVSMLRNSVGQQGQLELIIGNSQQLYTKLKDAGLATNAHYDRLELVLTSTKMNLCDLQIDERCILIVKQYSIPFRIKCNGVPVDSYNWEGLSSGGRHVNSNKTSHNKTTQFVLGRERVLTKKGRSWVLRFKGNDITLTEARAEEKRIAKEKRDKASAQKEQKVKKTKNASKKTNKK
jgi:hypothetical protein